jgi:hypothetical protein
MIAFLPIARYRVEYQVASGRPFSSFERLLLKAVQAGHGSVGSLAGMFAVHRRLVVEGLVTLMQAGWVSLGAGEAEFVLSASGQSAFDAERLPPTIALADRQITIVVEKVTGQVARSNEVDFQTRGNLKSLWDAGVPLRKGDVSNIVDPALISPLLPHQPTEWIRWIGPISVLSDNAAFAVVDIDTVAERITGVPRSWAALLLPDCLSQTRKRERERAEGKFETSAVADQELRQLVRREIPESNSQETSDVDVKWSRLSVDPPDVLWSPADHREAFEALLGDAITYVAISCSDLSDASVADLLPHLTSALNKGLVINVFLGRIPGSGDTTSRTAFAALKKLEYDSAHGVWPGRLTLGTRATGCWANIALADTADGAAAILGSYPWTAPPETADELHVSIRLRDAWAVARLCEVLAGFSAADDRLRLEAGFVRLRKAVGDLRQRRQSDSHPGEQGTGIEGRLLLDRDHLGAIHSMTSEAEKGVCIETDDLMAFSQSGWLRLLAEPSRRFGEGVRLIYSSSMHVDVNEIPVLESLLKNGVTLERRDGVSGTIISVDGNQVILTSSRSDGAPVRHSYSARIGLAIKGPDVVRRLFGGI